MKICIIGTGLIGGSLAIGLRENGFAAHIIGVDKNIAHAQKALDLGLVDEILPLEQAVKESKVILVTTPVNTLAELIPEILDWVNENQVVLEVGSTKQPVLQAVLRHKNRAQFVASHPMAGTEYSGPEAAKRDLFKGKCCVFCEITRSSHESVKIAKQLYESLGMYIIEMEGEAHDLHTAYVSHISHIASFALALTVLEKEKEEDRIFELASGGFGSTVRLAKSNAETWIPIFQQNRDNVLDVLDEYINVISQFRTLLIKKDFETFEKRIIQANDIKRIIG